MPRLRHRALDQLKILGYQSGVLPTKLQLYSPIKIYELEMVAAQLSSIRTDTLIDVCCGTGIQTQLLSARARRVLGIDFGLPQIIDARWHLAHSRWRRKITFAVGTAEALPLSNECADTVVCLCAIEHIPRPEGAIAETARLLKPGGKLIISADALATVTDDNLRVRHKAMYGVHRYFDPHSLSTLVEEAGLKVEIARFFVCAPSAVRELARCMDAPAPLSPILSWSMVRELRRYDCDNSGAPGLFVLLVATKRG